MATSGKALDITALGSWLWAAACQIRGPVGAPTFKDYILPPVLLKRLSDLVARWHDLMAGRPGPRHLEGVRHAAG